VIESIVKERPITLEFIKQTKNEQNR
jgi:hypothetical protein